MGRQDRQDKYEELRKRYPAFVYEGYSIDPGKHSLRIRFDFSAHPDLHFSPVMEFPERDFIQTDNISLEALQNLVFHIGMIECLSYWKATCSPRLIIKPFHLSNSQIDWWKNLYFHGLGEFFYLNGLEPNSDDFINIICESNKKTTSFNLSSASGTLIPVGGGKDSVVSLELLKDKLKEVRPLIMNPREATLQTAFKAGFGEEEILEIHRSIDPELLKLNEKGFLNGHTPFSALLAFSSLLAGAITNSGNITLSNEASADEPTVSGTQINHQYSKSFAFERDFREFVAKFISPDLNYYSFLRPLHEIQIAKIFSNLTKYHTVFRSCNTGSKTDIWCGKCAKCLFTFIILSPFMDPDQLENIFGRNLFDDPELKIFFDELTGISKVKPFECIGTIEEVNVALCAGMIKYPDKKPLLLEYYCSTELYNKYRYINPEKLLNDIYPDHFLSPEMLKILNVKLHE
jgi:UDP-N-acetyl-alpha-D-muramoyl-L-alanyl-L-glutamate epimerase